MKDTGSQSNLIDTSVAESCNLNIVKKDVELTINGFNSSKTCKTNIVKVPLRLGKFSYSVNAICVPNLNIKLNLPKLGKVVSHLQRLDYKMADTELSQNSRSIPNIQFILGSVSSFVLPVSTKVLGPKGESSILETPHGVMLEGNLSKLCSDLSKMCNIAGSH